MKRALLLVAILFILSGQLKPVRAQSDVVINEFSALSDPDWVEIYNKTSQAINIEDWVIRDSTDSNKIDLSGFICPNAFRKFDFSNRLNNSGDIIRLLDSDSASTALDEVVYFSSSVPTHQDGQSTSREPVSTDTWVLLTTPTPENDESCNPSPTPQSSPTNNPSPTPTSSTSSTTKKSPSPSPKKSPTPSPTTSPTPQVLGEERNIADGFRELADSGALTSPSPATGTYYDSFSKNFSLVLAGAGSILIGMSFVAYFFYKKTLQSKATINKGNERFEQKPGDED